MKATPVPPKKDREGKQSGDKVRREANPILISYGANNTISKPLSNKTILGTMPLMHTDKESESGTGFLQYIRNKRVNTIETVAVAS